MRTSFGQDPYFFEAVKLFSIKFVELRVDV